MFGIKSEPNDRYFEGLSTGEAKAYSMIMDIIENHQEDDAKAVLTAIQIVCEHELRGNPRVRDVTLFKLNVREL